MRSSWDISLEIEENEAVPLFMRIVRSVTREIERGRLKAGDVLPGTRAIAAALGIHRNTVDAAFRELIAQGWLETQPSRGTFVAAALPLGLSGSTKSGSSKAAPVQDPRSAAPRPILLNLTDGSPDPRLAQWQELARAYRRALHPTKGPSLGYGDPRGERRLRTALADLLNDARGLAIGPDDLLIARGSQMALYLIARALLAPGDVVAVEDPGYPQAWDVFRAAGAKVLPIPVDEHGIQVDALRSGGGSNLPVRAVYLTPHHQYPTTVTLSAGRRLELLAWAQDHDGIVIEDDYDHEFHYEGRPVHPLAATEAARGVDLVYIGSLSKLLAPSLRLGYLAAIRPDTLSRIARYRELIDRQGDTALEAAIAELIRDGELRRHARKARIAYEARRDAACTRLRERLGGVLDFRVPNGGLALWTTVSDGTDTDAWSTRALGKGLQITPGRQLTVDGRTCDAFRLGFASLTPEEMAAAIDLLAASHHA